MHYCAGTSAHAYALIGRPGRESGIVRNEYVHSAGKAMIAFLRRLLMHYGIYRRYPLARFSALRNAWRIARI